MQNVQLRRMRVSIVDCRYADFAPVAQRENLAGKTPRISYVWGFDKNVLRILSTYGHLFPHHVNAATYVTYRHV